MAERITELAKRLRPFLLSIGQSVVTKALDAGEGPGIDIPVGSNKIGLGGDTVLLYDSGGAPVEEYATIADALAAASSGDFVQVPAGTYNESVTVGAGIHLIGLSRFATIITGQVTLGAGATIENLSITRTANDANELIGVEATGDCEIANCHITVTQAGAGNAGGLKSSSGDIWAWMCSINVQSTGGDGYAGMIGSNSIYLIGGRATGSTDVFDA